MRLLSTLRKTRINMNALGIDIGGTKTALCIGNEKGALVWSARMATITQDGPERWTQRVMNLLAEGLSATGLSLNDFDGIGVSCPGPMSVKRQMILNPPNMEGWVNVPISRLLGDALGRPVTINNDANACALAEYLFGSHQGSSHLVYLTASTGLGAGVVVNGRVLQGVEDLAGEVGHHVLDIHGPACPCGQRGCWEMFCGGLNVAKRVQTDMRNGIPSAILAHAGGDPAHINMQVILQAVRENDAYAVVLWDEFTERMAQGIGTVIQFFNPEVIIMGTIAIHAGDLLFKPLLEKLPQYAWAHGRNTCTIVPSALGSKIGELSALALALG